MLHLNLKESAYRYHLTRYSLRYVCTYKRWGSSRNLNSSTQEPDRPQHDRPTTCVITQQYSSAIFVSRCFNTRKRKNSGKIYKKCYLFQFLAYLKIAYLKWR